MTLYKIVLIFCTLLLANSASAKLSVVAFCKTKGVSVSAAIFNDENKAMITIASASGGPTAPTLKTYYTNLSQEERIAISIGEWGITAQDHTTDSQVIFIVNKNGLTGTVVLNGTPIALACEKLY